MQRDDWAAPRSAALKSAQRWFGRLIGIVVPFHARLALATNGYITPSLFWRPGIILETIGRKSGIARRVVLTYLPDHQRIVLIASNYGRAGNPAWFENLVVQPRVKVVRRGRALPYMARVAAGDERRNLLRRTDDVTYGVYAAYSRKTEREIPVVVLTRDA